MKSKMLLALAGLLIVSMLFISPVSAQKVVYRANGKLEQYAGTDLSAEVANGRWNVKIKEGDGPKVEFFEAFYRELNIDEEAERSPAGTIDTFKLTLTYYESVEIDDDECIISGATIHVEKKWWNLETGKPEHIKDFATWTDVEITIDSSEILIDLPWTTDWDLSGPTLSVHY